MPFIGGDVGDMLGFMQLLLAIFSDSLILGSRNFTLIYILLLRMFLFAWIVGEAGWPTAEWRWFLLAPVLLMLFSAIMGGWYNMIASICGEFLGLPRDQARSPVSPLEHWRSFRMFFPGISRFWLPMTMGYGLYLLMLALLMLPAYPFFTKSLPILQKMMPLDQDTRLRYFLTLPQELQQTVLGFSTALMVGTLFFVLFSVLVMFWSGFVVFYRKSVLSAFWASIVHCFRNPLRVLGLVFFLLVLRLPVFLLASVAGESGLLPIGVQILNLLLETYWAIVVFAYLYRTEGPPLPDPEWEPEAEGSGSPSDNE